jgi:hypothetical protein
MEMEQAFELLGTYTAEQWGMVTAKQAASLSVDAVTLHRLAKARFLESVRRGVYAATTGVITAARAEQAVWLALNPAVAGWARPAVDPNGGVISHQSAARLHGLGELVNDRITITVPRRRTMRDPDVWIKLATLAEEDVIVLDGLPVTTVLRTVCDLLEQHIDASHIGTIIREGVVTGQLQLDQLAERIAPYARRYGARPHDGEGLLENLLNQIGLTIRQLTLRPAPPAVASEYATLAHQVAAAGGSGVLRHLVAAAAAGGNNELGNGVLRNLLAALTPEISKDVLHAAGVSKLTATIADYAAEHVKSLNPQLLAEVSSPALRQALEAAAHHQGEAVDEDIADPASPRGNEGSTVDDGKV